MSWWWRVWIGAGVVGCFQPVDVVLDETGADTGVPDPERCPDADEDDVCDQVDLCEGDDASGDGDEDGVCDDRDVCPDEDDLVARQRPDPPDAQGTDTNCDGVDGVRGLAVFAKPGAPNTSGGTPDAPVGSLSRAVELAARIDGGYVLLSKGAFTQPIRLADGVSLYGGYDADDGWSRAPDHITRLVGEGPVLVAIDLSLPTRVSSVRIEATSPTGGGRSSIAVQVWNAGDALTLQDVEVVAGDGAPGASGIGGLPGGPAAEGQGGTDGCDEEQLGLLFGCDNTGGFGGVATTCQGGVLSGAGADGVTAGVGGGNGQAGLQGSTAGSTANGMLGGIGGAGGARGTKGDHDVGCGLFDAFCCDEEPGLPGGVGDPGGPGQDGTDGASGDPLGAVDPQTGLWMPINGTPGLGGAPGGGGGSGGGGGGGDCSTICCFDDIGGASGGGGAGGCGGSAGSRGFSGGGSIGVFIVDSSPVLQRVQITTGRGGDGGGGGAAGVGAPGAPGGPGGDGYENGTAGGDGGPGGSGGRGGHGGGGAGGPSVGVWVASGSPVLDAVDVTLGIAGSGGVSLGASGDAGLSAARYP